MMFGRKCPQYTQAAFVVSDSNRPAYSFVTKNLGSGVILGPHKSGKTHLAHIWSRTHAEVLFYEGEDPSSVEAANLVCDDAMQWGEEVLFHLYNAVFEKGGHILFTMEELPVFRIRDLESRMHALLKVRISSPGHAQARHVLEKILKDHSVDCRSEVLDYAALHLPCSYEAIHEFVDYVVSSLPFEKTISFTLVRKILQRMGV